MKKSRRDFLNLLPYVVAGGFIYPTYKFVTFKESNNQNLSIPLKDIKEGITFVRKSALFIYKNDKKIDVYSAHCTHMGCILNYFEDKEEFKCPCHKSRFDKNGNLLRGPAKRDLDRIIYKIKNKTLYIG